MPCSAGNEESKTITAVITAVMVLGKDIMKIEGTFASNRVTRRELVEVTGAALGGLAVSRIPAQAAAQQNKLVPIQSGMSATTTRDPGGFVRRDFIVEYGFRNSEHRGVKGFEVLVRQTSYSSSTLYGTQGFTVTVDGEVFDAKENIFILNDVAYNQEDLKNLTKNNKSFRDLVWWFARDDGKVFVPRAKPLAPGKHTVEVTQVREMRGRGGRGSSPAKEMTGGRGSGGTAGSIASLFGGLYKKELVLETDPIY